jgi:hypothetical protein
VLGSCGGSHVLRPPEPAMDRVDSLLLELSSRHRNHDPRFLEAVRPMLASILDAGTPPSARVALLELLAETFERDRQVRIDCANAKAAWQELVAALQRMLGMR